MAGVVGEHRVRRRGLHGHGERGAAARDPARERDEGVRADEADRLRGRSLELLRAVPGHVVQLGRALARGRGLLGSRHHLDVVEENVFKAPSEILLVSQKYFIEVPHPTHEHSEVDV